ncbi:MAG: RT0821/Lpp0805 family surface protein [Kiloniellales bacterium]|nr:RT0821/Lpp0805 family surface protein [Kiloniellales bacterium]
MTRLNLYRPRALTSLVASGLFAVLVAGAAAPVAADPPPWAPAHGWRAKHDDRYDDKHYHKRDHKHRRKHVYKRRHEHDHYERERYAGYQVPYGLDLGRCNRTVLGGVLGGAAGAALGSTVDKHDGRTAAIVGGTIIGVLVGGAIGQYMDSIDQNCIGQTLEHVPDGETIVWRNPNVGGSYQVTPAETYQRSDGRYCREYITEVIIGGRREQAYGTACRQPDGSWKVVRI